jgi:hypothetical protein
MQYTNAHINHCTHILLCNGQVDSGEEAADDMNDDGLAGADDDEIAV